MKQPQLITLESLCHRPPGSAVVWCVPEVAGQVLAGLPFPVVAPLQAPGEARTLIVVGGGVLLDEAKVWRLENAPALELIAIPSLWGSGAEASPIAVLNREGKKVIRLDPNLLPDARVIWPELATSIPPARAKLACGDCWSHALEGFLSPLANDVLRDELAQLMNRMLAAPLSNDPVWFELSAQACAGQARSSVGLVHGIAHTLEGPLRDRCAGQGWGHARLCSLFLWPVMRFNAQASSKLKDLAAMHSVDLHRVMAVTQALFDETAYELTLPALRDNWLSVLRDPCTRTNVALVRPASIEFFVNEAFR